MFVAFLVVYFLFKKLLDEAALAFLVKKGLRGNEIASFLGNRKYTLLQILSLPGRIIAEIISVTALSCIGINLYGAKVKNWLTLVNGVILTE